MNNDLFWTRLEPLHEKAAAFCRKLAGSHDEGDDLYQESLLTALRRFETLRDPAAFRPWLYRIMVNSYKNRLRQPWRRRAPMPENLPEATDNPVERLTTRRWLERAFKALKPPEKALVVLFELEGWSVAELAELYGRPVGTIKARLSRARRKMLRELTAYLDGDKTEELVKGSRVCVAAKPESE
ncbi:MAG: RNA polymerase sigma factor [Candidatus Zixiibacteriota bacterium]